MTGSIPLQKVSIRDFFMKYLEENISMFFPEMDNVEEYLKEYIMMYEQFANVVCFFF